MATCKKLMLDQGADAVQAGQAVPVDGTKNRILTLGIATKPYFLLLKARGDATLADVRGVGHRVCGVWEWIVEDLI